jgi:hypothetical protein
MPTHAEQLRKQVDVLWKQAVVQLEEVKRAVIRTAERHDVDLQRLRAQRDKLLKRFGEETHRLANDARYPVPTIIKRTVDRLNEVIDVVLKQSAKSSAKRKNGTQKPRRSTKRSSASSAAKLN